MLPAGFRNDSNDSRIMVVALNLRAEGRDVCLITKDVPLRVKAAAVGLDTDEYRAARRRRRRLDRHGRVSPGRRRARRRCTTPARRSCRAAAELPTHTGLVLLSSRGSALGRVTPDKQVRLVRGDREAFGLHGRSAEQRIALDLLLDPEIGIVSLGGRAGTGKSALALCAGLESVMERRAHKKVVIFRPLYAVGGQELGYLPGGENEKMSPWAQAVYDTLGALVSPAVIDEIDSPRADRGAAADPHPRAVAARLVRDRRRGAVARARGAADRAVPAGPGSRVVLTHDVAQRDNLRVGRHDGIAAVIEALKGHPLFAHVTLTRSERSPIAALVTEMLEDLPALTPGAPHCGCCSGVAGVAAPAMREQHPQWRQRRCRRAPGRSSRTRSRNAAGTEQVGPGPAHDLPGRVAHGVLAALLLEDGVSRVLAGA